MQKPWCWWCCHPFKTDALAMPITYDAIKDSFEVYGTFCSFGCMKAYNHNEPLSKRSNQYSLISLYMEKCGEPLENTTCAPPRQMLDVFGGELTIDCFRNCAKNGDMYHLQIPSSILVSHTIEKQTSASNYKWIKTGDDGDNRSYSIKEFEAQAAVGSKVTNNALKIKQASSKPSNTIKRPSTLEMVLGLVPDRK